MKYLLCLMLLLSMAVGCSAPAATNTPAPRTQRNDVPTASNLNVPRQVTSAASATPTPVPPTIAPSATPAPTQVPAALTQLTSGGCCVQPFWYPDSESVLYLDKPAANAPTGFYRVMLDEADAPPELWSERIANYTGDMAFAIIPEAAGTRLIRLEDNKEFRIRNGGRGVQISPDRTRVVWTETRETFPAENRLSNVMLANIDGTNPKRVFQTMRGGVSGWLDNNRLLMTGRLSRDGFETTLFIYNLTDGTRTDLISAERLRQTTPSPDGSWLLYSIVNDPDASLNGLWMMRTDGTGKKKLDVFGAAQWRDGSRLIYAPLEPGAPTHAFYEFAAETGATRRLTPADGPTFKIAAGDWDVSPDGNKIVFVNAADKNIWLWRLNE